MASTKPWVGRGERRGGGSGGGGGECGGGDGGGGSGGGEGGGGSHELILGRQLIELVPADCLSVL